MDQPWTTLGLAVVLFASTNVDDVFVLIALFSAPNLPARHVVAGQSIGMLLIVLASAALSILAVAVAAAYVGLLGLGPLGIGIFQLVQRSRGGGDTDEDRTPAVARTRALAQIGAVTLITVANGADNLGVYVPAFATRSQLELWVLGGAFIALTLVWCGGGYALVQHPQLGKPIRRYAAPAAPWVLIALGVFILVEAFS